MPKTSKLGYIKRYLLCIPILNGLLFLLSVPGAIIRVWLDGGNAQLIMTAGVLYAVFAIELKVMIVWALPARWHAKFIGEPRAIWVNALLLALLSLVALPCVMPIFEFYRAR